MGYQRQDLSVWLIKDLDVVTEFYRQGPQKPRKGSILKEIVKNWSRRVDKLLFDMQLL